MIPYRVKAYRVRRAVSDADQAEDEMERVAVHYVDEVGVGTGLRHTRLCLVVKQAGSIMMQAPAKPSFHQPLAPHQLFWAPLIISTQDLDVTSLGKAGRQSGCTHSELVIQFGHEGWSESNTMMQATQSLMYLERR